jgi:hypothetical protein
MMRARLLVAALALALGAAGLPAQEVQVPADQAGQIRVITAELARRLGLFAEVEAFREARLFRLPDGNYLLEITSGSGNQLRRERQPLSADEAAEFRRDLTARITARAPTAMLDQGGRTKLLVGSMVLGLGYYGWATAMAFDPDDSQTAVAIYMLTAGGSFLLPYLATQKTAVPDAAATMSLWGAMRGPIHGYLTSELGGAETDKTKFAWSVLIGATEAIVGGVAARGLGMTAGRAELTGAGGDIGLGVGYAAANLLKVDGGYTTESHPYGSYTFWQSDRKSQSAVMLLGSGLGLAGAYLLGGTEEWTRGDAAVFRNAAAIGALAGIAVGDIIHQPRLVTQSYTDPETGSSSSDSYYHDRFSPPHSAGGLIGAAAGAVLGRALATGRNFSTSQGTFLTLAPLAGGLLGLGIAYVATPERQFVYDPSRPYRDPNDHSELYLTMSALGAGAGFAAMYPAMAKQARAASVESHLQLSLNPLAAAQIVGRSRAVVPLASVNYRF